MVNNLDCDERYAALSPKPPDFNKCFENFISFVKPLIWPVLN
jgi:hypothetical protein